LEVEEAKTIVDEIKRLRLTSDEKISNFLQSNNILTVEDKLKIFQAMAANLSLHIDHNFLINHLHEVASDSDEFAELLLTLSQKNGTASLSTLADLYSKSRDMALGLYNRLINKSGQWIATPVAYTLQGIGRRDTDKLLQLLDSSSDDPYLIIGQIGALRMLSFEQRIGENQIQRVMQQLGSSNSTVRLEALHFLLTAQIDIMGVMEKLMELMYSGDIETKRYIAGNCYEICRKEPETALKLLTKLSEFDDVILLNGLTFSLGCIGSIYPVQCLKMIQRWYRKDLLRNEDNLDWLPEQIGKGESKEVNGFLLSWIADEDDIDILTFNLPTLVCHIFERNDKSRFAEFLDSANLADKKQVRVISKAVEMI
jgi:hypothetical protein